MNREYHIKKIDIQEALNNISRSNLISVGIGYGSEKVKEESIAELESDIESYNGFVSAVFSKPEVIDLFVENGYFLKRATLNRFYDDETQSYIDRYGGKNRIYEIPYKFKGSVIYDVDLARIYKLTDESGNIVESFIPGKVGGHSKLKIYGRLDCPSAIRHIEKGNYVKPRVFFKDEETAVRAGYRPCAICMPEEYKRWKKENS